MTEIFAHFAYVSINGKMRKFNLVDFKDNVFYIYSNGNYMLRVEIKVKINKIMNDNKNFKIIGVLKIFEAQELLIIKNIFGEYSC